MLKVVSNTTPIISLLKIDELSILKDLYGKVILPQEVYYEIENGKKKEYYVDLSELDWIEIKPIKDQKSLSYFLDLDKGEAETIILAKELDADLVIIDERLGRFHAKHADLNLTGTLGILLKAKKKEIIKEISPLLLALKAKDIWLDDNLIDKVLKLANEK